MIETDPKIREKMKEHTRRAILRGIVTKSTDVLLQTPAEREASILRGLMPARFKRCSR